MTKTDKILKALIAGEKLTVKSCMKLIGTHKLSARIGELEQRYFFTAKREWIETKSRYGDKDRYMAYSLTAEDKKRLKRILVL